MHFSVQSSAVVCGLILLLLFSAYTHIHTLLYTMPEPSFTTFGVILKYRFGCRGRNSGCWLFLVQGESHKFSTTMDTMAAFLYGIFSLPTLYFILLYTSLSMCSIEQECTMCDFVCVNFHRIFIYLAV